MAYCPRCDRPLELRAHGVLRCGEHGAFLPALALRRELVLPRHVRKGESFDCPVCLVRMREVHVPAGADHVRLDRCQRCEGWWFDATEVERVRGAALADHEARPLMSLLLASGALGGSWS
ncbi:MAG TPA: zf-TFIIB domain-containing protein [Candidatus Thermoplasmatota archaeon]|nr:zf-TFIIB domain-containing protein [Candidatus Thermoplasmatota archaeon]